MLLRQAAHRVLRRPSLGLLVEHCCAPGAGGYTPSDFPLAGLDQAALDLIQQQLEPPAGGLADVPERS